jgi:hypothetical protein
VAAFGQRQRPWVTFTAAAGAVLPDLPSIGMVLWALGVQGRDAEEVFQVAYFSAGWQAWLAPWHSAPLWGLALLAGFALRSAPAKAFAAAGLLHLLFDFPVHAGDAHRHLWPLSDWRLESPVSYWDLDHYAAFVAPMEVLAGAFLIALLWRWSRKRAWRAGLVVLGLLYLAQAAALALWAA